MSINFKDDMGPEARSMIKKMFDVKVIDEKTALFDKTVPMINRQQMGDIARAAKQMVTLEVNEIGDRKEVVGFLRIQYRLGDRREVGGIVYELDETGWRKLPIGTTLIK